MKDRKEYHKKYRQEHEKQIKQYRQKYKEKQNQYNREYRQEHKNEIYISNKKYNHLHMKECNNYSSKYHKTEKGKVTLRKQKAKRRNLGFTILLENKFNCDVDYHHINNEYVIAVPRYIHQGTSGKNHRVECNSLVEKLYNIDIENEVEKYERDKI